MGHLTSGYFRLTGVSRVTDRQLWVRVDWEEERDKVQVDWILHPQKEIRLLTQSNSAVNKSYTCTNDLLFCPSVNSQAVVYHLRCGREYLLLCTLYSVLILLGERACGTWSQATHGSLRWFFLPPSQTPPSPFHLLPVSYFVTSESSMW